MLAVGAGTSHSRAAHHVRCVLLTLLAPRTCMLLTTFAVFATDVQVTESSLGGGSVKRSAHDTDLHTPDQHTRRARVEVGIR